MADKNLRLQIVLEALDKVTAPLKNITGASSGARKDLAKTQAELKALDALQQQVGRYKATETRYGADIRQYEEMQARLKALRDQLDATEKPTKKLRAEFERAEKQAAQLSAQIDLGGADLQQLSAKLSAAGIDVGDLAGHEDRLADKVDEANRALRQQTANLEKVDRATRNSQKLNDISQKATGAGLGMIAAGTATAAPIAVAVKQAMTLESAMADVRKVVDFPTPQAFEAMSDDILNLSTRVPMAAEGIAQIVAAAGRANVPREELMRFAEDAAKMGVAFDSTAEDAGATMAKWRTAFGLPQDGVVALADQINALTNSFGGDVGAVTEMVTRIGPLGKVGGLAAAQIAAMSQVLSSVGVESEVGATGIKNMMLALTKGKSATKSQQAAFQALGLDAVQMSKDMQTNAGAAITNVLKRIQAVPKEAQAGMLTDLFGSESVGAIAPMLTSLDQLEKNFGLVGDSSQYAGSMNKEFLAATATTEGATGLAVNGLSALNITMGKLLLPTVVAVADKVSAAASVMRGWAQEHPIIAKGIMIFFGAGAALLVILGGLALAFAAVTAAAAPLAGILTISVGALLGWMVAIVAAIAAVAAIAYLIYDNWGAIVGWFGDLWASIKALFTENVGRLIKIIMAFSPIGLFVAAFAPVLSYLRGLDLTQIGRNLIQGLIGGVTGMLGALKSTITGAAGKVAEWFKEKLGIHSPSRVFAGLGGFVMAGLDRGLDRNSDGPLARIADLADGMARTMGKPIDAPPLADPPVMHRLRDMDALHGTIGLAPREDDHDRRYPPSSTAPGDRFSPPSAAATGDRAVASILRALQPLAALVGLVPREEANDRPSIPAEIAPEGWGMAPLLRAIEPLAALIRLAPREDRNDPLPLPADDKGRGDILDRMIGISATFGKALARGATMPAIAAAAPVAAQPPASATGPLARPAAAASYTFHINVGSGAPVEDIKAVILETMEEIERERRARAFADNGG